MVKRLEKDLPEACPPLGSSSSGHAHTLSRELRWQLSQPGCSPRSFSCLSAAPRLMQIPSPLDKGGLAGGFGKGKPTHPGAPRPLDVFVKASQAFTPSDRGDFQRSFSCRPATTLDVDYRLSAKGTCERIRLEMNLTW